MGIMSRRRQVKERAAKKKNQEAALPPKPKAPKKVKNDGADKPAEK